jgi:hypothetical protein
VAAVLDDAEVREKFISMLGGLPIEGDPAAFGKAELATYKERADALVDDPDKLNQGSFSVCGMTSALRSLLQYDRDKFVELVQAVFRGTDFQGISVTKGSLLEGRFKQLTRKVSHDGWHGVRKGSGAADRVLDFILARSLGKLLKTVAPEQYNTQLRFSARIVPLFDYDFGKAPDPPVVDLFTMNDRYGHLSAALDAGTLSDDLWFQLEIREWRVLNLCGFGIDKDSILIQGTDVPGYTHQISYDYPVTEDRERVLLLSKNGDSISVKADVTASADTFQKEGELGLNKSGMTCLMQDVIKTPSCKFSPAGQDADTARAAVLAVSSEFDQPSPYVYGLIKGGAEWMSASRSASSIFDKPPAPFTQIFGKSQPDYEHIVALTGKAVDDGRGHVTVPTWSWARRFDVSIPADQLPNYFFGYLHGQMT